MKFRILLCNINLFFLLCIYAQAQTEPFDLNSYKQFLSNNQNMTSGQLLNLHPTGIFKGDLKLQPKDAVYFDSICFKYNLTEQEKSLIQKNGFMVSERLTNKSFGEAFGDIWHKDLPVFISTDAILHALHMSYDEILKTVEVNFLIPKLDTFLKKLKEQQSYLHTKYSNNPMMTRKLYDLDIYLTVAIKLMGDFAIPYYSDLTRPEINKIFNYISAEKPIEDSLFSSTNRIMDYSQFKVRGHYTDSNFPKLATYFKTMMWLGRTEIYLLSPRAIEPAPTEEDIQRQTIDALLVNEAIELGNLTSQWKELDDVIKFFVGESDNVTPPNLKSLVQAIDIKNASDLLDKSKLKSFQDSLKTKAYAFQRILSQIIMTGFNSPDSIIPASSFLLFGQRFIIDSYVTSQVVFDKILFNNSRIKRMLPSTLDVLYTLGNDASAQLLVSELDKYHYSSNLAALRYLIDGYDNDFWEVSLYNLWLNSIRKLNPPNDRTNLPQFMQSAGWWQEKMNTQLSSWAQLRHDNLLYAKQSYSGGVICSYPFSFVEPVPEFYDAVNQFCARGKEFLKNYPVYTDYYFEKCEAIMDTLSSIAKKELNKQSFSEAEKSFLRRMLYNANICGQTFDGWYLDLFYTGGLGMLKDDKVIADVHTAPTDEFGNMVGWILHAGTGPINLGVFIAEAPDNQSVAFVGPVMSYYEHLSTNFYRLSDEEWKTLYDVAPSMRPDWVNVYLADSKGNSKGEGLKLITGIEKDDNTTTLPETMLLAHNYPNPFNSTTIIRFTIPAKLSNQDVKLNIFDLNGELVKQLLNENLPGGNYLTRWDGTDNNDRDVTSGVYFYNLTVGGNQISGKMSLIK
ncbi:MAG: DUF3160 domain-containing protein [Ignavibacteriales bacterium]|nr:DUF3160 domain-containing protein [Ignavibacteriales bacterium]